MSALIEMFAKLGLDLDRKGFETADHYIDNLRKQTAAMVAEWKVAEAATAAGHKHFDSIVLDTARAARGATDDAVVSWEGWNKGARKGINWAGLWQKAVVGAVAAAGAAFAVYRGAQGVAGLVHDTAQAAGRADDLGQQLGITGQAVQELGYAAIQNGSNVETLASGLGKLADTAQTAKAGSKEAAKAFKSVGMSARDITSGKVPLDQALLKVADQFAAMPDGAKKSALAMDLFGKSGKELIPLLNSGSDGIRRMQREARETGYAIDQKTTLALAKFGDETDTVKAQLAGIRNEAVKAVLPALLEMVKGMQAWIKANRADIVKGLVAAMRALMQVLQVIGPIFGALIKTLAWFGDHVDFAKALFLSLATFGTAVLPLFYALTKVLKHAGGLFESVGKAGRDAGRTIRDAFSSVWSFISDIANDVRQIFEKVLAWIERRVKWLVDRVQQAREMIGDAEKTAKQKGGRFLDVLTNPVGSAAEALGAPSWVKRGAGFMNPLGLAREGIGAISSNSSPRGPRVGGAVSSTSINVGAINVTSTKADPAQVAVEVDGKMREFFNKELRVAKASVT
mgnify:CR=1 FL=1